MPMPAYPVKCYGPGCDKLAEFKVAARWSDGITRELKTYSLCCAEHAGELWRLACERRARCRTAPGEELGEPEVFEWSRELRDSELAQRPELQQAGVARNG